jgi:hypothetical protein
MEKATFCRERADHYRRLAAPMIGKNDAMAAELIKIAEGFEATIRRDELSEAVSKPR